VTDVVTLDDLIVARERIAGHVHRTPIFSSRALGEMVGARLALKAELFQKTGSFKVRGVFNKVLAMSAGERARGFVSCSAGNHAAALAFVAKTAGVPATIVMPAHAVKTKIEATRGYGGEVVLTEGDVVAATYDIQRRTGMTLVHPFDDPAIIAGHGTMGLEIMDDSPEIDVVVVPIGGGGLASGVAAAVKLRRPAARVIGVEPITADVMTQSLAKGEPMSIPYPKTIADGLAAPFTGAHTLRHVRTFVDEVVRVSDDDIVRALLLVMERCKLAAEPSGAAAFAALLSGAARVPPGAHVVCIVSGGNADRAVLKKIL
jgi:threonine dehydratase